MLEQTRGHTAVATEQGQQRDGEKETDKHKRAVLVSFTGDALTELKRENASRTLKL